MDSFNTRDYGRVQILQLTYRDGNTAVQLVSVEDGEDIATLSVNMPDCVHHLQPGEFFPKTYSENERIAQDALVSGAFVDTGKRINTAIGRLPIWHCR
jgi:hypothetical protein